MMRVENTPAAVLDPIERSHGQILGLKREYPAGYLFPPHFHNWNQLLYASTGAMNIRTNEGIWVVPALRAVWIPARTSHEVCMSGAVSLRTLYLKSELRCDLPRKPSVLSVCPFFKELILFACDFEILDQREKAQAHLISVILDQLQQAQTDSFQLPHPSDIRAQRVAGALMKCPGDERKLEEICKSAGGSKRTIERLFRRETGLSLGKWRQQLRLMYAFQLIASKETISSAAVDAGYSTPSAFISSFRNAVGTTPRKYFHGIGKSNAQIP
ncbi:MAG: helix-turn-helix transcriptional regulator [Candidatus Acidiferrales bacterium]